MQNATRSAGDIFRSDAVQRFLALGALIVLIVFFSIASEHFLNWSNFKGIFLATSVVGILAMGVTFVIITAGIDLSVGTNLSLSAVITEAETSVILPSGMIAKAQPDGCIDIRREDPS